MFQMKVFTGPVASDTYKSFFVHALCSLSINLAIRGHWIVLYNLHKVMYSAVTPFKIHLLEQAELCVLSSNA